MTATPPAAPAAVTPPPTPPVEDRYPDKIIIRPWPKVVFLYPTWILTTILWFISLLSPAGAAGSAGLGNVFMLVFCLNLLVFSFDFSRIKSITILISIVAVVFLVAWLNTKWQVVAGLGNVLEKIDVRCNTQFFGFLSGFLAFVFLLVLINSRFNYFEINTLEILHHHGYLGDITRMPTSGLHFNKEIYDMVEYALLRSGRLILFPTSVRQAIVIDNVPSVNKVEEHIKNLLSVMAVKVELDA